MLSKTDKISIRIEGPYYGNYSLAQINRNLIKSFSKIKNVSVSFSATNAEKYKRDKQTERELYSFAQYVDVRDESFIPDVAIRHTWPFESSELKGTISARIFPWEESKIPFNIITELNEFYDLVFTPSDFCMSVMQYNGVANGTRMINSYDFLLDNNRYYKKQLHDKDRVRYVHVSSGLPRKAPDILIESYCAAFSDFDNTELTIKTSPNPHMDITTLHNAARRRFGRIANTIKIIYEDLSQDALKKLLFTADFAVYPSRGEGFGLPIIEAHFAQKPCIIPQSTALKELFIKNVDYAVDSEPKYSKSHVAPLGSVWWEPSLSGLTEAFRKSYLDRLNGEEYNVKQQLLKKFSWPSWDFSSRDMYDKILKKYLLKRNNQSKKKKSIVFSDQRLLASNRIDNYKNEITVISTYNSMCGIADYTKNLLKNIGARPKILAATESSVLAHHEGDVIRCWTKWSDVVALNIFPHLSTNANILIQHHSGFYGLDQLQLILNYALDLNCQIIVEFHSVLDNGHSLLNYRQLVSAYSKCKKINFIVHSLREIEYLDPSFSLNAVLKLCPHPFYDRSNYCELRSQGSSRLIAAFGFMRTHKGFSKLIEAFRLHKNNFPFDRLLLLTTVTDDPDSKNAHLQIIEQISKSNLSGSVEIISHFADLDLVSAILGYVDCVVFPYDDVPEGASGAIRVAMSAGAAVICSDEARMFDEFDGHVLRFSNHVDLSDKIGLVLNNRSERERLRFSAKSLAENCSFSNFALQLKNFFNYMNSCDFDK